MMNGSYGEGESDGLAGARETKALRPSVKQFQVDPGAAMEGSSGSSSIPSVTKGVTALPGGSPRYAGGNPRRASVSKQPEKASGRSASPHSSRAALSSRQNLIPASNTAVPSSSFFSKSRGLFVAGPGGVGSSTNPSSLGGHSSKPSWLDSPAAWMTYYFLANLSLTLYNKLLMNKFPFPWALTGIHTLCGTLGCQVALMQGHFTQQRLSTKENLVLVAFSSLYTVNIAVSNLSLNLVTIPFHQVVRAMTPLFTIVLATLFLKKRSSRATYLSLIPVVMGVAFATYGDYYFTTWGLILTLIGTLLAAMKTIVTNMILVGRLKLQPLDLLIRMSPLAFMQCVLASWWTGELDKVRHFGASEMNTSNLVGLFTNGAIAFALNVVSFTANKKTSALTMTVAANVKQVLTIILAVLIFHLHVNPTNLFGITMTLLGGGLYAKVELDQQKANAAQKVTTSPLVGVVEEKRALVKDQRLT